MAYWRHARKRYSESKVYAIRAALRVVRQLYGREKAASFGPKRLAICRDQMLERDWGRSYTNEAIGWVRRAFRYAAAHELIEASVHRRLEALEPLKRGEGGREPRQVRPVERAKIRKVRQHLSRQVRALIDLQLLTGARAGELVELKPTDFDRSGAVWTVTLDDHKTAHHDKARTLYFGPKAQRIVGLFMRPGRPMDKPLFSPREANAERKATGGPGRRPNQQPTPTASDRTIRASYTVASYRRAIARACAKAFPPPATVTDKAEREAWSKAHRWHPHQLRHNAATFLRREFGLDVASVVLGHSTLAITQTYAELNDRKAKEVIARVG